MTTLEALVAVMKLIEDGELVRNIQHDMEPGWALRMVRVVSTLAAAKQVLDRETGVTA